MGSMVILRRLQLGVTCALLMVSGETAQLQSGQLEAVESVQQAPASPAVVASVRPQAPATAHAQFFCMAAVPPPPRFLWEREKLYLKVSRALLI